MDGDWGTNDFVVIGAGISGLMCAARLQSRGLRGVLLDKGRGVGGRMATRRIFGGRADHGAQYITCRDARFKTFIDRWLDAGVLCEWFRHLPGDSNPDGYPRYIGAEGMTSVPKALAQGLDVRCGQLVTGLSRSEAHWEVTTDPGERFYGRELIVTAPLPQTAALLDASNIGMEAGPGEVEYEMGIAAMVVLDAESGLPGFGGLKPESEILSWMADNRMKGISGERTILTLHSTPEFAEQHWDAPDEVRGRLMIDEIAGLIKAKPLDFTCHRWRYTTPINPHAERCRRDERLKLTLAGDAFGGLRIESAALSGLAAAYAILADRF